MIQSELQVGVAYRAFARARHVRNTLTHDARVLRAHERRGKKGTSACASEWAPYD